MGKVSSSNRCGFAGCWLRLALKCLCYHLLGEDRSLVFQTSIRLDSPSCCFQPQSALRAGATRAQSILELGSAPRIAPAFGSSASPRRIAKPRSDIVSRTSCEFDIIRTVRRPLWMRQTGNLSPLKRSCFAYRKPLRRSRSNTLCALLAPTLRQSLKE